MRIETHPHSGGASTSLNHRTSRLANLELSHTNTVGGIVGGLESNFKSSTMGGVGYNKNNNDVNPFGQLEIKEIKQFIENFKQEDQLEKHNKALDLIIEEQKIALI